MAFETTIAIGVDPSGAKAGVAAVRASLDTLSRQGNRAVSLMDGAFDRLRRTLFSVQGVLGSIGLAFGAREFIKTADTLKLIEGRLKLVTKSTEELTRAQRGILRISNDTRQSFEGTAQLYTRVARGASELADSQDQLFKFTEATNKAIQVSGATASEAAAGIIQFSQALSSGQAAGDEFRSIVENIPRLATAIAEGFEEMGFAVRKDGEAAIGFLRRLRDEGKLTTDRIFPALLSQADKLDAEFRVLPKTVGQAFTVLRNNLDQTIGAVDKATGASKSLSDKISEIADTVSSTEFRAGLSDFVGSIRDIIEFAKKNERELKLVASVFGVLLLTRGLPSGLRLGAAAGAALGGILGDKPETAPDRLKRLLGERADAVKRADDLAITATEPRLSPNIRENLGITGFPITNPNVLPEFEQTLQKIRDITARIAETRVEIENLKFAARDFSGEAENVAATAIEKTSGALKKKERITNKAIDAAQRHVEVLRDEARTIVDTTLVALRAENDILAATAAGNDDLAASLTRTGEAEKIVTAIRRQGIIVNGPVVIAQIEKELEARDRLNEAISVKEDAQRDAERQAEEAARAAERPFIQAAENIQSAFADAFTEIFRNGEFSFEKLTERIKDIFARLLAELFTLAIARPIIVPIIGSVAGSFGLNSGQTASLTNNLGGGGGGLNLGSFSSFGGGNGPLSSFLNTQLISGATVGSSSGALIGPLAGPFGGTGGVGGAGASLGAGGATIGSFAGGAGAGFAAGTFLNSLVGGNSTGGTIGSAGGAIAGALIGSVVPGIGTLIGGLIGGAGGGLLGGLFGNDTPPGRASAASLTFGANGAFSARLADDDATDQGKKIRNDIVSSIKEAIGSILAVSGGQLKTTNLSFEIGERDPTLVRVGGNGFFPGSGGRVFEGGVGDAKFAAETAIKELLVDGITGAKPEIQTALANSLVLQGASFTPQKTLADLQLVKSFLPGKNNFFDALEETAQAMREAAIHALELGLSLEQVNEGLGRQRDVVFQQNFGQLQDFRDNLSLLPFAPITPLERLEAAKEAFDKAFSVALGGDIDALERLPKAASDYLKTARDLFASGPKFVFIFNEVKKALDIILAEGEAALEVAVVTAVDVVAAASTLQQASASKDVSPSPLPPAQTELLAQAINLAVSGLGTGPDGTGLPGGGFVRTGRGGVISVFTIEDLVDAPGGMAHGGLVVGRSGTDRVPANLTNGEFVMRPAAVQNIGLARLNQLNASGGDGDIGASISRMAAMNVRLLGRVISELQAIRSSLDTQGHGLDRVATRLERRA